MNNHDYDEGLSNTEAGIYMTKMIQQVIQTKLKFLYAIGSISSYEKTMIKEHFVKYFLIFQIYVLILAP